MERMLRVNELLHRELGELVERAVCRDFDCLVTITAVDTNSDLRQARVFVSVYGSDEQKKRVMARLHKLRKEFQTSIAKSVVLKYTPRLLFELDHTIAEADRVGQLLDQLVPPDEENKDVDAG